MFNSWLYKRSSRSPDRMTCEHTWGNGVTRLTIDLEFSRQRRTFRSIWCWIMIVHVAVDLRFDFEVFQTYLRFSRQWRTFRSIWCRIMIMVIAKNLRFDFHCSRCSIDESSDCGHFRTLWYFCMKMLGTLVHWCEYQVETFYWIWFCFWNLIST